jgi:hypothetical protein
MTNDRPGRDVPGARIRRPPRAAGTTRAPAYREKWVIVSVLPIHSANGCACSAITAFRSVEKLCKEAYEGDVFKGAFRIILDKTVRSWVSKAHDRTCEKKLKSLLFVYV